MTAPKLRSRNYPPEHGILVPVEHQGRVIRDLLATTAMRPSDADFLAERLLTNDARCLFSHGSFATMWRASTTAASTPSRRSG